MKRHKQRTLFLSAIGFSILTRASYLLANPQAPTVIAGSAVFNVPDPSTLHVTTGEQAIINWNAFSIASGELTQFIQPGANSAVLNRVTGGDLSAILGALKANGRVYLINPNGILIGNDAVINTNSFVASTLDIDNAEFLRDGDLLFTGDSTAGIVNLGKITADNGDVILIGYTVDNQGELNAPEGGVRAFAGQELILHKDGDEKITIRVKTPAQDREETGISQEGTIRALTAELKADGNLYTRAINHSGKTEAKGIVKHNGQVYLYAPDGLSEITGHISAQNADGTGGTVRVLGDEIAFSRKADVDASGEKGGGTILIGGDYQGKNDAIPNATHVYVSPGTRLNASADQDGDGGKVVVWANETTTFYGNIVARGGEEGGDGGFAEVSGKQYLDYNGTADLRADKGNTGNLLLDPTNLSISSSADVNVSSADNFFPINAPNVNSNLNNITLQTALGTANVTVQTGADGGTGAGDINWDVSGPVAVNSAFNLTVESANDLNIDATFSNAGTGTIYYHAQNNINVRNTLTTATTQPVVLEAGNDLNVQSIINNQADGKVILTADNALNVGTPAQTSSVTIVNAGTNASPITLTGREVTLYGEPTAQTTVGSDTASGPVSITSTAGNLNVQGNSDILSQYDIDLHAYNGDIRIDPILSDVNIITGTTVPLADVALNAYQGDIILENSGITITGYHDTTLNAPIGSIDVQGNAAVNLDSGNTTISATTGTLNLIAGENITADPGFTPQIQFSSGGMVDVNAGDDLRLSGSTIAGSGSGNVLISGTTGVQGAIGHDLILEGGGAGTIVSMNSYARISNSTSGDINLTVGNDVILTGGTSIGSSAQVENLAGALTVNAGGNVHLTSGSANDTYAQLGTISSNAFGAIDVTAGQDITLDSSLAPGSASYALIGHSLPQSANQPGTFAGNISVTGGEATDLNLIGGTLSFAQIGHAGSISPGVSSAFGPSDILINHIGGNINLNPLGGYAVIGHSNATTLEGNIAAVQGNITINQVGGDVNLLPGTADYSFTQIGHYNGASLIGDIAVSAAGNVNVTAGNFLNSSAVIGHGNFFTPATVNATANIAVNALNVNLNGGGLNVGAGTGTNNPAVIGFLTGQLYSPTQTFAIIPDSTINVHAQENVTVQAGWGTTDGGNAVIGHIARAPAGARINHIDVTADSGNIDVYGGSGSGTPFVAGTALIGTASLSLTAPFPESDVNVNAPNGQVSVVGLVPGLLATNPGTVGGGLAAITNASQSSPFDVTVNGQNVLVAGADSAAVSGAALIGSGRNTNVTVDDNLRVLGGSGSARISALSGTATFDVGGNVDVIASNSFAQIGNNVPFAGSSPINFTHVGGNVTVQGGAGAGAYAEIGHGQGTSSGTTNGDITFTEIGGNVVVQGGSNSSFNFAQIGHSGNAANAISAFGDILMENIAGNVNINAGTSIGSAATIGHSTPLDTSTASAYTGEIHVKANSAYLTGGTALDTHAAIGFNKATGAVGGSFNSQLINVELDGVAEVNGGVTGNAFIGFYNPTATPNAATIRNINVEAIDGNVQLTGGTAGSAAIGTVAANANATSQIKVTTHKDVALTGGSTALAVATIANANAAVVNANDVIIDPSSLILLANAGNANIYSSGNLNINYNDSFYINYDALNPSVLQSGPASVVAQRNIDININNESVGDLVLQGGDALANSSRMIAVLGDINIGTRNHTGAGNVTIGTAAQVGPAVMQAQAGSVFINAFGNLSVIGSAIATTGTSLLNAFGKLEAYAGGNITVAGTTGAALISSTTDQVELTSGGTIAVGVNGTINSQGNGSISLTAEEDVTVASNGEVSNTGNGQTNIDAGRDLAISGTGALINFGSGDIISNVGRDTTMIDNTTIIAATGGNFIDNSGRDFTMSNTASVTTNGESDLKVNAGRDITLSNTAQINHLGSGQLVLNAGDSLTLQDGAIARTSLGDIHVTTGQDAVLSDTAELTNGGNGQTTLDLGRDLAMTDAASITNVGSGDIIINALRDTTLSDTTQIVALNGGNVIDHSGRNVTLTDAAQIESSGDSLMTITAGNSISLSDASELNHNSTGILTLQAGLDLALSDNAVVNSNGDVHTSAGQDTTLSGASIINVNGGGDFTNASVRDVVLSGSSSINTSGHSIMDIQAGNSITMSNTSLLNHDSTGILTLDAGVDITLNDTSRIISRGDVHTSAGQDTVLNGGSSIALTNGGDFTNDSVRNFAMSGTASLSTTQDGNIDVKAGHSILVSGSAAIHHNSTGTMNLTAVEDVALSNNALVQTTAGNINIKSGQDTTIFDNAFVSNLGDGQTSVDAGRDLALNQQGAIVNTGSGDILTAAGRDTTLNGNSRIVAQDGGNLINHSGRNFTMTGTSLVQSNGSSIMTIDAGKNISLSNDAFINHDSSGILTLNAGEDILVSDTADINTRGDLYAKASQDMILTQSADIVNLGNGETNIEVVRDFRMRNRSTLINEGSGDITIAAGRDTRLSGSSEIEAEEGGSFFNTSGRDFKMEGSAEIETHGESYLSIEAGREILLEDRAFIDHDARGVLCLKACQDLELEDRATVRTEHGDAHFEAGRDIHVEDNARVLAEGRRPLEMLAHYDIRVIDDAIVANSGSGDLTMIADHNMDLLNNAQVTTNGGNLHLVVDNDWPCPPFYGVGRIYKDTNVTLSTNGGALRVFTSVRGFNTILGLLNGIPFLPEVEFKNTPLEQWNSYYLMAFNGHPYTIFYKNGGIPQRPIQPSVVNNFRIATNEGFYDWRVVDQFLFSLDYFTAESCMAANDCCDPCEEDGGNAFTKFYRFLRKKYLNYHTKQLDQL